MQTLILTIFMLGVAAYALRRGEQPERSAALLLLCTSAVDQMYHLIAGQPRFDKVDPVHLVIDTVVLVGLLYIALQANRGWPLWACAAQLIVMLAHIAKFYEVREVYRGYWVMTQVPFLLQLGLLAAGTAAHAARCRHIGPYHSWRMT